jgi:hypothetical protein
LSDAPSRARVTLHHRRLWTTRVGLGLTRWVLYIVAAVGVTATARNAIDRPVPRTVVISAKPASDARFSWFALSFARAYLAWSGNPLVHQASLSQFVSPTTDRDVGLTPAPASSQRVAWVGIAAERTGPARLHVYTVAVSTQRGVRYLAVAVTRGSAGLPVLARYPSLVAAPAIDESAALDGGSLPTVTNGGASAVLKRALRNYVGGSAENLAADLAPRAAIQPVGPGLTLSAVVRLALEPSGAVLATLRASDSTGDVFTLAYQISLRESHGRWEITRIGP